MPPEFSGRDYAIFLLRIAAEVEHSLMAQYLFAAYTLGGPDVPDALEDDVRAWQETILGVAKEEMGHLITVQNLLTVLGAARQFDRDDYPNVSPLYPFGFRLEPLSLESLAAYVCAESRPNSSGAEADEIKARAKADTGDLVNRVGAIFDELIRLFEDPPLCRTVRSRRRRSRSRRAGTNGVAATARAAGNRTDQHPALTSRRRSWSSSPADSRSTHQALRATPSRGGLETPEDENDSHFIRFLTVYRALKDWVPALRRRPSVPTRAPASPRTASPDDGHPDHDHPARGPALGPPVQRPLPQAADQPVPRLRARHRPDRPVGAVPARLADPPLLRRDVQPAGLAGLLVRLPVAPTSRMARGRPTVPDALHLGLPSTEANRWRVHRDTLDAADRLYGQLRGTFGPDSDGQAYLAAVAQLDQIERAQVELLIGAAPPVPVPVGGPVP